MVSTIMVREANDSHRDVLIIFHQSLYQDHRDKVVAKEDLPLIEYRDYERILRDDLDALLKDASPITHLTKDDAPVFLVQYARAATPGNIHHPKFGEHLKSAADALGVECVAKLDTDYSSMSETYAEMVKFMQKHFAEDH